MVFHGLGHSLLEGRVNLNLKDALVFLEHIGEGFRIDVRQVVARLRLGQSILFLQEETAEGVTYGTIPLVRVLRDDKDFASAAHRTGFSGATGFFTRHHHAGNQDNDGDFQSVFHSMLVF